MIAVIQRVSQANVTIEDQITGAIGQGLMILLGIETEDSQHDADWLIRKILALRIFNDHQAVMNLSVQDVAGELMIVSQFTLHASTRKGNRPSYIKAARPEQAIPLYEYFIDQIEAGLGKPVAQGTFGADMQVSLINDGPVTIIIDTKEKK